MDLSVSLMVESDMNKKKVKSIRKQIMSGYSRVILVMCLLVVISLVSLVQVVGQEENMKNRK